VHPLIVAALLLLQSLAPEEYTLVQQYQIQVEEGKRSYGGYALCKSKTIVIVIDQHHNAYDTAGTLAHEAKHLSDSCPYNREAMAYRYELHTFRKINSPLYLQIWAARMYWKYYWYEHPGRLSLGILP